jgi:hypothetical protein
VVVTAASVPEGEASTQLLPAVYQMGQRVSRLYLIWVFRHFCHKVSTAIARLFLGSILEGRFNGFTQYYF